MNPLIEKYEEVYGKKPVEGGLIDQLAGADSPDTIKVGDTVIPTAQVTPNGINLTGDYIDSGVLNLNTYSSNRMTMASFNSIADPMLNKKSVTIPSFTEADKQFGKVMDDLSNNKAVLESIKHEVLQDDGVGFGVQVRYTVTIVGTYP